MTETAPTRAESLPVAPVRSGAIVLARHGEPALSRKIKLTSDGYRDWWGRYEVGGLLEGQTPPDCLVEQADHSVIYHSTRPRAIETARAVARGRPLIEDPIFIEAPLPPPNFPDWFRVGPRAWGVISRFWWWAFDHHGDGEESRDQAKARARQAADMLEARAAQGDDVLVLAHGFFNGMVGMELTRRGWRCTRDRGFQYWCGRKFEKR
ncbi:histidine phosphatase family protein [Brevundimonas aveniformis]|uniref:histidine phosphatase family protein n=1 Tax=Brevundimonas aveniformis TaxID=370977 RepID=UPI0024902105|nr:histidine phosphatase family protein [Brevundimonas aveniformis]